MKHKIKYSWCHTDSHKSGRDINTNYRTHDFVFGELYGEEVANMLKRLDMPMPKKSKVFRGRLHDMLFFKNHGIVAKIGGFDINSLVCPTILQPLGFITSDKLTYKAKSAEVKSSKDIVLTGLDNDRKCEISFKNIDSYCNMHSAAENLDRLPLTIALYPGISLKGELIPEERDIQAVFNCVNDTLSHGYNYSDCTNFDNYGFVSYWNEQEGKAEEVSVILDVDNEDIEVTDMGDFSRRQGKLKDAFGRVSNKAEAYECYMVDEFGSDDRAVPYINAFKQHQKLRFAFWDALKKGNMDEFYDSCAKEVGESLHASWIKKEVVFT